jgi:transposase, IS605 OrfB family, central region
MIARYKYRFYPTDQQKHSLAKLFGCARYVWNEALAYCHTAGKYLGYNQLSSWLTQLKKSVAWLREVSSVGLQQSLRHLDKAYQRFFNKEGGAPRYRKKKTNQSTTLVGSAFSLRGKGVYLAKIGVVKPIWSRELPSQPSSVTVIKDSAERYFLSFVVEVEPEKIEAKSPSIGVDLGIKIFAACSDEMKYYSPNYAPLYDRIAQLQKQLARRVKGSNRWERTRLRIAKLHCRIDDMRTDFLHKLSTKLTNKNQVVVLEDLNVRGMLKNRKLSKAISRQGWRTFRTLCEAKAEKFQRELRILNRWEATSQHCSKCGWHWGKLDLSTRVVVCDNCGTQHCRDANAAKCIEQVGMGHHPTLKRMQRLSKTTEPKRFGGIGQ